MNWGKALAMLVITLSVLASVGYFLQKDYRRSVYWASSAVLVGSVTF